MSELCEHDTFKDICGTCYHDAQITRLTAELRTASDMNDVYECRLQEKEAENKKLRAALKQAGTGLNAGLFQYAARDFHGNIVPGDEQYPWIRAMQIGLDAVTTALPPPPALSGDKHE
jgi:hypothetical protein